VVDPLNRNGRIPLFKQLTADPAAGGRRAFRAWRSFQTEGLERLGFTAAPPQMRR
jgi:hypothetical protein